MRQGRLSRVKWLLSGTQQISQRESPLMRHREPTSQVHANSSVQRGNPATRVREPRDKEQQMLKRKGLGFLETRE